MWISDNIGWVRNAKQKSLSTIKMIIRLVKRLAVDNGGKMGVLSKQKPESLLYWAFHMDNDFRDPVPGLLEPHARFSGPLRSNAGKPTDFDNIAKRRGFGGYAPVKKAALAASFESPAAKVP